MQMQEIQEGLTNALRATPGLGLSQEQARKAVEVMFTHLGIKKMAQSVLVPDSSCHLPLDILQKYHAYYTTMVATSLGEAVVKDCAKSVWVDTPLGRRFTLDMWVVHAGGSG
jgi:hypothetical protein